MSDFLGTLWTVARQAPLSVGFPRQEESSGLPSPSPGHLPDSGFEPVSPASAALAGDFFMLSTGEAPMPVAAPFSYKNQKLSSDLLFLRYIYFSLSVSN